MSSRGAVRFYYPDFIAVQKKDKKEIFWIIETKGREWEDTDRKEAATKKWCHDVSKQTEKEWKSLKDLQNQFKSLSDNRHSGLDPESRGIANCLKYWIPAFAGMTNMAINAVVGQTLNIIIKERVRSFEEMLCILQRISG